jgi:hypothetical protein
MNTFIDKRGVLNHLIPTTEDNEYFSYENIIKNRTRVSPWKQFFIKLYDSDGNDLISYVQVDKSIFYDDKVIHFTRKFNPELII